jgi:hypothetical protein
MAAMVQHFLDDDLGYLNWLRDHPRGYVVFSDRKPTVWYLSLHRVRCIRDQPARTTDYRRICADTAEELIEWGTEATGSPPKNCEICHPS